MAKDGIEPSTSRFHDDCSTTKLLRQSIQPSTDMVLKRQEDADMILKMFLQRNSVQNKYLNSVQNKFTTQKY